MSAHALTIDVIRARVRADVDRERVRDAAPELLAALEGIVGLATTHDFWLPKAWLDDAKAAIATAKGTHEPT